MRYINLHLHYITLRITHGHRNRYVSIGQAIYDFLLTFHSNHGPISYSFRDKRRFQSKIAEKNYPMYFAPLLKGFPWNWVPALGIENKLELRGYPRQKFDDIFSHLDTVHQRGRRTDRRTDRQTDIGRQQRPRLCIASRSNHSEVHYAYNLTRLAVSFL